MPRVDPQTILDDWAHATQGELIEKPAYVLTAEREVEAERQLTEGQHWFDATLADVDRIIAASSQLELALPKMTQRALARQRFARMWQDVVAPFALTRKEATIHEKMKLARREARVSELPSGKLIFQWDEKAGLPLYDPDDAREESMRLSRRMVPRLTELLKRPGHRAYYLCGTAPNSPRGELAKGQRALYRRWYSLIRACKRKDRAFPIVGAVAVMESPLGRFGDWHPHLNIIVVCDGWLDFKALKQRWHWNMEMRPLDGHQSAIERAFREIIKYSCRTVSEKSLAKSQSEDPDDGLHRVCGAVERGGQDLPGRQGDALHPDAVSAREGAREESSASRAVGRDEREAPNSQTGKAPAMEEWGAMAILEFHRAHQRFRRSRAYRALFGLPKPLPIDLTGLKPRGRLKWDGRAFQPTFPLLESIPGDKSTTPNVIDRFKRAFEDLLGPPIDRNRLRDAVRRINEAIEPVCAALK